MYIRKDLYTGGVLTGYYGIIFAITPIDGSHYKAIVDLSNTQEFFSSASKFLSCDEERTLELRKDKKIMNIT